MASYMQGQSIKIFDLEFFTKFDPTWATDRRDQFTILVKNLVCYSNFSISPGYDTRAHGGINNMERPRGVNLIYSAGGDPLCTLHRAEGLYG